MLFARLSNDVLASVPGPVSMICSCTLSCTVSTGCSQKQRCASTESSFDQYGTHAQLRYHRDRRI